jgi:SAM-dependent methyltransferase
MNLKRIFQVQVFLEVRPFRRAPIRRAEVYRASPRCLEQRETSRLLPDLFSAHTPIVPCSTNWMLEMNPTKQDYVPAAGRDWLLPLYDPLLWLSGAPRMFDALIEQAAIADADRVLDVGCGTGSLAIQIFRRHPRAEIVGVDPDPKALARARRKAERAQARVRFEQGFAQALPVGEASFDRVTSSFMLHHLPLEIKQGMLADVRRVLAPGGSFHLMDFMPAVQRDDGLLARVLHGDGSVRDNGAEQLRALLVEAGFTSVEQLGTRKSLFGRVGSFRAVR